MPRSLKIHIWGGFGSQLNGLATAIHLKSFMPLRVCHLYFHTSGVTYRPLEISELVDGIFPYIVVNDYSHQTSTATKASIISRLRKLVAFTLYKTRYVIQASTIDDLKKIKPWTSQLRGHYSYCNFSLTTLSELALRLSISGIEQRFAPNVALHYRLGDLLQLDKSTIAGEDVANVLSGIDLKPGISIFTESIEESRKRLKKSLLGMQCKFHGKEVSTLELLRECISANTFIGTNSKVSIWVTIFRIADGKQNTFMPASLRHLLSKIAPESKFHLITFF